jgi:sulfate/thiosulfate transport system permease protein
MIVWSRAVPLYSHAHSLCAQVDSLPKRLLLGVALAYIVLMVILPFVNVFIQAFAKGPGPFLEAVAEHDFIHATKLTLMLAAIAVPLNTVFGTVAAILITRNEFPGKVCCNVVET